MKDEKYKLAKKNLEKETEQFFGRGLRVLAEVMKEQRLLKPGQDERDNRLFQKGISLWAEEYKNYISHIENSRKSEAQQFVEVAARVVQKLRCL
jgi:hypothetical protein